MSRAPRVVLDTNVVLSALVFAQGRLAVVRYAWQSGRCQPLVSPATASELVRALAYPKFGLSADEQRELLADYLPYSRRRGSDLEAYSHGSTRPPLDPWDGQIMKTTTASSRGNPRQAAMRSGGNGSTPASRDGS